MIMELLINFLIFIITIVVYTFIGVFLICFIIMPCIEKIKDKFQGENDNGRL